MSWKGPGIVIDRTGTYSYVVQIGEQRVQEAHRTQLRRHIEDEFVGEPLPLFYTAEKATILEAAPDTYMVEAIQRERVGKQGRREFLTRWRGFGPEGDTWEPFSSFFSAGERGIDEILHGERDLGATAGGVVSV